MEEDPDSLGLIFRTLWSSPMFVHAVQSQRGHRTGGQTSRKLRLGCSKVRGAAVGGSSLGGLKGGGALDTTA